MTSRNFKCGVPECGRTFGSSGGLHRHRSNCMYYQHQSSLRANFRFDYKRVLNHDATGGNIRVDLESVNLQNLEVPSTKKAKLQHGTDIGNVSVAPEPSTSTSESDPNDSDPVTHSLPQVVSISGVVDPGPGSDLQAQAGVPEILPASESAGTEQSQPFTSSGRPVRSRRLPARFRDPLPEPSLSAPFNSEATSTSESSSSAPSSNILPRVILHVFDSFLTSFNKFGIARFYRHRPSYDPDAFLTLDQLCNSPSDRIPSAVTDVPSLPPAPPWPWKNMGIWRLMTWMMTGSNHKSGSEVTRLVHEVILSDDFNRSDFNGFNAHTQMKHFDKSEDMADERSVELRQDRWKESSVDIEVPTRERKPEGNGQRFTVPGLFHRPLTGVIRAAFAEKAAKWFHLTPFKRIWRSPLTGQENRLYDELYTSDVWLREHDDIQKQRRDDGCKLERVIAGLMFWSDSTHLAQFGNASAWPVYLFFGNQSKYTRGCPNSGACHPIAFIPTLPETIQQFVTTTAKKKSFGDVLAHCKRELFHAVWRVLLDDEFIDAYRNGIVIKCHDGVYRRVFPRIFTYSADYPEKVLVATIRDKGGCPCPRCFIPKTSFHRLGLLGDLVQRVSQLRIYLRDKVAAARSAIYNLGSPIKGSLPEAHLKATSLVPTFNTFADTLGSLGCNVYRLLVVDLLHEFELGIFKTVFRHLLRILNAVDPSLVAILNDRFRRMPPFGKNSIRKFPPNVSEVRQCAARHFEDILQCAIPAFEALLPAEHDVVVRILLFRLAHWHALAKLRLHTDETLRSLEGTTRLLGSQLRKFHDFTCQAFRTMELPSETAARWRRKEAKKTTPGSVQQRDTSDSGPRPKSFNLSTYKLHALGDYVGTIRLFGTTDSYTTQIGELAHRLVKKFYQSTNKKGPAGQIARQERRHTRVRRQRDIYVVSDSHEPEGSWSSGTAPEIHHRISDSPTNAVNLAEFLRSSPDDPALQDFIPKLKDHLLSRLLDLEYDGDEGTFSDEERNSIRFVNNLNGVLRPKRLQINYTTYDMRRDQDTLHPGHGSAVMLLSREDDPDAHPFWYAEVLGAFLITVNHTGEEQKMEFVWVRWLGIMPGYRWGLKNARLPKVGFVPFDSGTAFGFLDPSLILRACHLIPAFADGRTDSLLRHGPSAARQNGDVDDWAAYYVNIFADRDMFVRYTGAGVGHHAQYFAPTSLSKDDQVFSTTDTYDEQDTDDENSEHCADSDLDFEHDNNDNNGGNEGEEDSGEEGEDYDDSEEEVDSEIGGADDDSDSEDGDAFKF